MLFGLAVHVSTSETRTQNWLPLVGCRSDDVYWYLGGRRNTQGGRTPCRRDGP